MNKQKRVAAIHDISCFGRCSLTVALPIISAAGIETCVIPTAVLSTHTGGIDGYTYRDLTDDIIPIADHWRTLDIKFDSIYSGYLGSFKQLEIVSRVFDMLNSDKTLILIDPVMADNGKLYKNFSQEFPAGMRQLCTKADVIVPNITEAVFMLGEPYVEGPYTESYIEKLIRKMGEMGPGKVVLTGVHFDDKQLGAAAYDTASNKIDYYFADRIEGHYHGTGDVFGSALLAALLKDYKLIDATAVAVDFTVESIQRTKIAGTDVRFGVDFENGLAKLAVQLND